jgi:23S rRNA pseudouridine1911/1915/1917 synthase
MPDLPPSCLRVDGASAGIRADAFLCRELPFLSRTRVRQKIQTGESLLNGKRYASSARLREGDLITLQWRGNPDRSPPPELEILYEDEYLLAVNKPAGVPSHPMGRAQSGTVIQSARQLYARSIQDSLNHGNGSFYPSLVNRLDTFTSGIVLIAKVRETLLALQDLAAHALISKEYAACVEGRLAQDEGRIALPIGRDHSSTIRVKMTARPDGLPSVTDYRVRRRLPGHTLLSAFPQNGRQHQIRVHLAALGHPVWGDLLYKDEGLFLRYQRNAGILDDSLPSRQCLHAERVSFIHPMTGALLTISAPVPRDFLEILERLE